MDHGIPNAPLPDDDPRIGEPCWFCRHPYEPGDVTNVVSSGPINNAELRKARRGLPYIVGPPVEVHVLCGDPKSVPHHETKRRNR
jgi:hypothetical protein